MHFSKDNLCEGDQLDVRKIEFYIKLCALLKPGEKIDYYYEGRDFRNKPRYDYSSDEAPMKGVWNVINTYTRLKFIADEAAQTPAFLRAKAVAKAAEDIKVARLAEVLAALQAAEADVAAKLADFIRLRTIYETANSIFRRESKALPPIPTDMYNKLKSDADAAYAASIQARNLHNTALITAKAAKDINDRLSKETPLRLPKTLPTPIPLVRDNIRWQTGDIRFWTKFTDEQKLSNQRYISVEYLIQQITYFNSTYKASPTTANFINIFKAVLTTAKETGKVGIDPVISVTVDDLYAKYITDPYSMISYQLNKIPDTHRDFFKGKLKEYIAYAVNLACGNLGIKMDVLVKEVKEAYAIIIKVGNQNLDTIYTTHGDLHVLHNNKTKLRICEEFVNYTRAIEPDLYMFARSFTRMLVPPDDGVFSTINVFYYGNAHTNSMRHFLLKILNIGDYVLLSHAAEGAIGRHAHQEQPNRCIELTNPHIVTPLSYILAIVRHFKSVSSRPRPDLSIYHAENLSGIL